MVDQQLEVVMSRTKILLGVAAVVAWFALSLALLFVVADEDTTSVPCPASTSETARKDINSVDCPTEDSCTVDYRDGAWHIAPVEGDAQPSDSSAADEHIEPTVP